MRKSASFFTALVLCLIFAVCASAASQAEATSASETTAAAQTEIAKVTGVKCVTASEKYITLTWDAVENAQGYAIYSAESGGKFERVGTVKRSTAKLGPFSSGTTYSFKIRAYAKNEDGKTVTGKFSEVFTAATSPSSIKRLVTKDISTDSITLSWSAAKGATHYEIYIFSKEKNSFVLYGVVEEKTVFTVSDLLENRIYTFRLRPVRVSEGNNAFGAFTSDYSEFTDTTYIPYTKAQAAKTYNNAINLAKKRQDFTLSYQKTVFTYAIDCSRDALMKTFKNIMNLFDGEVSEKYTFKDGKSGSVTADSIIEPYNTEASLKGNDILSFKYTQGKTMDKLEIKLRTDTAKYANEKTVAPLCNKTVTSLVQLETLRTTPVKIKSAVQTFDGVSITAKIQHGGVLRSLVMENPVLVDAQCKVSTVNFTVQGMYAINQTYKFSKEE